jgi:hypothetical protein
MRLKHFHLPNAFWQRLCPLHVLCHRSFPRTSTFTRQQRRTLISAVTNSPALLTQYGDDQPPPEVISTLVDAAFAWAEQGHRSKDPPTHAVVLVSKALIPRGKEELLQGLSQARRLAGLNALIGVVDAVGEGAKGVSVFLATRQEGVQIETLTGLATKELRVGRWHAKDKDEKTPFNFDQVMASIRGGESMRPVERNPFEKPSNDFIFALGEMESMNKQAAKINSRYPSADVVCPLDGLVEANGRWELLWH